jgi:hypothetical protein
MNYDFLGLNRKNRKSGEGLGPRNQTKSRQTDWTPTLEDSRRHEKAQDQDGDREDSRGGRLADEDITLLDAPTVAPSIMQRGPMTRARRRQLNLEVSSFLSDLFYTFENKLLPNDVILIRNIREGHEELRGSGGGDDD